MSTSIDLAAAGQGVRSGRAPGLQRTATRSVAAGGKTIVASAGVIDESEETHFALAVDVLIAPHLEWLRFSGGMRIDLIRRAVKNPHVPAVCLPAGSARGVWKAFIGQGDATVVFGLKLVFGGAGLRIAALPELIDKTSTFIIC